MSCRQGDWMCGTCHHINFQKRDLCQRCACPKYTNYNGSSADIMMSSSGGQNASQVVLAGDWYCGVQNCGAHNYASRNSCYKCCASKDYYGYGAAGIMQAYSGYACDAIPGWKNGDWICNRLGCGMHNYASRMECLKCHTPRDFVSDDLKTLKAIKNCI
ncbi:hypothetical protein CASFOL_017408 [Castilleja foliolosa]|uniref:RanBP2-type domain-containing protein n=1 Tax=Castilleja foliolosa TaxID=1961234 RepID=A0ABD3DAZ7_9LAMI